MFLPLGLQTEMKLTRLLWSPHPILAPELAPRQRDHFWQSQLQPAPIDMKLQHRLGHFETQKPVPPLVLVALAVFANPIMAAPTTSDFPLCFLRPRWLPRSLRRLWIVSGSSLVNAGKEVYLVPLLGHIVAGRIAVCGGD